MNRKPEPALQLKLFGVPAIGDAQQQLLRLSLKRAYALLAYLALEGRSVPRDHVAALLWPGADATLARARMRRLIYQIEDVCSTDLFDGHEGGIALIPGVLRCDAVEFRRIARALVARGAPGEPQAAVEALALAACEPLMEGLTCDSEEFDDWARTQRVEHEHLLSRTLTRLAEQQRAQGRGDEAACTAERLLKIDPYAESAYVLRMALAADCNDGAGVDAVFTRCAQALRAEFGTKPSPATEQAFVDARQRAARSSEKRPQAPAVHDIAMQVRFAVAEHGPVAYATIGQGSEALVVMPGFVSHIEIAWEHPGLRQVLCQLAERFTVVVFDRRGVGLSERLGGVSTVESAAADVLTILDAAHIGRAWLFGSSEGGPAAVRLAALHPSRVSGLMLFGAMARGSRDTDYPWALQHAAYDTWMRALVAGWGGPADIETFAPALQNDPWTRAWWARMLRHAASPASLRAVLTGLRDADVRALLPRVGCPTMVMHRRGDRAVRFQAGEYLAARIRDARFVPMEGGCHWWWVEDPAAVASAIVDFAANPAALPLRAVGS